MNNTERIELVKGVVSSLSDSIKNYEAVGDRHPIVGYGIDAYDSKESIKRRCMVARVELLKIIKSMEVQN